MPLRDHFHAPVTDRHSWDSFHGGWPMMIVRQLFDILPEGYISAPTVHFGKDFEIDVTAFEENGRSVGSPPTPVTNGPITTEISPEPTLTLKSELADQDEFDVRVYDTKQGRRLVAAIEIVSPSNKDWTENRWAFVAKVSALLQKGVCVSIVDLVTVRHSNMYADLLERINGTDPGLGSTPPHLYAVTIRDRKRPPHPSVLDIWFYPMAVGQPLPTLPLWLAAETRVLLPLEEGYEETCRLLHIP